LNHDIFCAIDTETTGLQAGFHDIIEIAIVPLTYDLKPDKKYRIFDMMIKPGRPENVEYDAMSVNRMSFAEINANGFEAGQAADMFDEWFDRLNLAFGKRIVPVAANWPHDRAFIMDWLGVKNYEAKFSHKFRDIMGITLFMNDHAAFQGEAYPVQKHDLTYLCNTFGVPRDRAHRALDDAFATAEVYRRILTDRLSNFQQARTKSLADLVKKMLPKIMGNNDRDHFQKQFDKIALGDLE
jgi:DNA polymerase III epsilon subunit-like protein